MCNSKKSKFIREQEEKGLLSMIGELSILGQLLKQLKNCIATLKYNTYEKIHVWTAFETDSLDLYLVLAVHSLKKVKNKKKLMNQEIQDICLSKQIR